MRHRRGRVRSLTWETEYRYPRGCAIGHEEKWRALDSGGRPERRRENLARLRRFFLIALGKPAGERLVNGVVEFLLGGQQIAIPLRAECSITPIFITRANFLSEMLARTIVATILFSPRLGSSVGRAED